MTLSSLWRRSASRTPCAFCRTVVTMDFSLFCGAGRCTSTSWKPLFDWCVIRGDEFVNERPFGYLRPEKILQRESQSKILCCLVNSMAAIEMVLHGIQPSGRFHAFRLSKCSAVLQLVEL